MNNFDYYNPTRILFGDNHYTRLPELIKEKTSKRKIMLAYGGGSIHLNGVYQNVMSALDGFVVTEFKGIEANPEYSTLMKAVEICREQEIDFILAVGGGSVIDGVKFICGAVPYEGEPWDVLERKPGCNFEKAIPFGTVLTLPATGSEANSGAVISRSEIQMKRTMGGPMFFPHFSICDPHVVASLPQKQIANGIVDAYMHTLEQYLTFTGENLVQERQAEGILSTLLEVGPTVYIDPKDYDNAAQFMWCATQALNGLLRCGVTTDWATHMIAHELTALHGIDHARTLAIVGPSLWKHELANKKDKLAQYGSRVFGLAGSKDQIAHAAIEKTIEFFLKLDIPVDLKSYTDESEKTASIVEERFAERGWLHLGERKNIGPAQAKEIIMAAT